MAVGKNKGLKGKRGKGKKVVDPFTKKEWYDIRAPSNFAVRNCGKTPVVRAARRCGSMRPVAVRHALLPREGGEGGGAAAARPSPACARRASHAWHGQVSASRDSPRAQALNAPRAASPPPPRAHAAQTKSAGTKLSSDSLKGRIFEVNLADLNKDEDQAFRKMYLECEEVQGMYCLTNFYGMSFTTDKLRSLVRKWQTLVEAHMDVKTTDGYVLRLFCIGFTRKRPNQLKKTCYAKAAQVKAIRAKMREVMVREASTVELKELVNKFIPEVIGKEVEKACQSIFPLQNVFVRKAKIMRKPKFDMVKLLEMHGDIGAEDTGKMIDGSEKVDPLGVGKKPTVDDDEGPAKKEKVVGEE